MSHENKVNEIPECSKCRNAYQKLWEEKENFRKENERLEKENKELRKAYKSHVKSNDFCDNCGQNIISGKHKPDCYYMKLIGDEPNY